MDGNLMGSQRPAAEATAGGLKGSGGESILRCQGKGSTVWNGAFSGGRPLGCAIIGNGLPF